MKYLKYILFSILLSFIYINKVNATTCVYDSPANFLYKYNITCNSNGSNNATCTIQDSYNIISIAPNAVSLVITNTCPSKIYITAGNNQITSINDSSGEALNLNKKSSSKDNSSSGGSGGNSETKRPGTTSDDELDLDNFCQGPVQGVFTTLGWVFFIVKIVIPVLLVIFGSIDVAKAVISSKDDELKKSIKTLTIRVIAGFIIFFIPTILSVIVKMIDNNEVYNGTFWDCTKCMLEPNNDACSGLRGQ